LLSSIICILISEIIWMLCSAERNPETSFWSAWYQAFCKSRSYLHLQAVQSAVFFQSQFYLLP
jgi:hypothetical protein